MTDILNSIISTDKEKAQSAIDQYKNSTINKPFFEVKKQDRKTYHFFKIIIESMPFPVFIKDENGCYLLINALELQLFGLKESEVIGKNDSHFLKDKEELDLVLQTDQEVLNGKREVELPNQRFSIPNGTQYVFKTHKMLFINPFTNQRNILGFSIDVTDSVNLNRLKEILVMTSNPYV